MEIVTTRFGTLNVEDERVIDFPKGLLGFPDRTRYALIQTGEENYFFWLQCVDEPNLAFVVTDPSIFFKEYEVPIKEETQAELSLTDLAERAGLAYPTAHREVGRLLDSGILCERQVGRARLIRANAESPLVDPLREILTVVTGPVVILAEELARIDGIEAAFLYGSFAARLLGDAGPAPHDIDLMVLGEPDVDAVYEACTRVEAAVHRPVNPTILTPEEFAASSGFLDNVRSGSAVAVIGELPWQ